MSQPFFAKTKNKDTLTDRLVYLEQKLAETVKKAKPKKFPAALRINLEDLNTHLGLPLSSRLHPLPTRLPKHPLTLQP